MNDSPLYAPERGTGPNAFQLHTTTVNYDDAALLTPGVVLWTPQFAGEVILGLLSFMNILVAFNGTTPRLRIAPMSDLTEAALTTTNINTATTQGDFGTTLEDFDTTFIMVAVDPIVAVVDDGAGGAVGGTTGRVEISLVTIDPRDFVVA